MNPRQFLTEFVDPAVDEWRADPLNIRRAICAMSEIDNLAEHTIIHALTGPPQRNAISTERDRLGLSVPAVGLIRDVHDTHKHGPLTRKTATIKSGQRPQQAYRGGAFDPNTFSEDFDIGTPVLVVVEDRGTEHLVDWVIDAALAHWLTEIERLGL